MSDTDSPRFVPADHIGRAVEIYPHIDGFRASVKTVYGVKPAFVADVVVLLDGDEATFESQLLFNAGIVADLRKKTDGEPLVGILQRVETAAGRTAIVVR